MFVAFAAVLGIGAAIDVLCLIPAFALWLVAKLEFKGLLLTVGTSLFVFAKGIVILHLLGELHLSFPWPFK